MVIHVQTMRLTSILRAVSPTNKVTKQFLRVQSGLTTASLESVVIGAYGEEKMERQKYARSSGNALVASGPFRGERGEGGGS